MPVLGPLELQITHGDAARQAVRVPFDVDQPTAGAVAVAARATRDQRGSDAATDSRLGNAAGVETSPSRPVWAPRLEPWRPEVVPSESGARF
jgi:hypothetical protein